jgi:hypothetical protein
VVKLQVLLPQQSQWTAQRPPGGLQQTVPAPQPLLRQTRPVLLVQHWRPLTHGCWIRLRQRRRPAAVGAGIAVAPNPASSPAAPVPARERITERREVPTSSKRTT